MEPIQMQAKERFPSVIFFLLIWAAFVFSYIVLKIYISAEFYAGMLSFFALVIVDIAAAVCSFFLWKHSKERAKRIFLFFTISFLCLAIDDSVYNIAYNVLKLSHAEMPSVFLSLDNIAYLGYLVFQFFAWISIFSQSKLTEIRWKNVLFYVPVIIIAVSVLLIFLFVFKSQIWQGQSLQIRFYNVLEAVFQVAGFVAAILCLTTARYRGVFFMALGYFIGEASGIVLNFGIFSKKFGMGSFLETLWPLVLLLMIYGLIVFKKTETYTVSPRTWICEINSLRSQSAFWTFAIVILSVTIFLGINYLLTP